MLTLTALALLAQDEPDQTITTGPIASHPERWVKDADYPMEARRNRIRGTVAVTLEVDDKGRTRGCNVTSSSRSELLDRQTCRLLLKRARFTPALGPYGPFASRYYTIVHWPPKARR